MAEERAKEWLQCVEVGGKELVQSLEDSHIQELDFALHYETYSYYRHHSLQLDQSRQALKATAATVNTARRQKGLPDIYFSLIKFQFFNHSIFLFSRIISHYSNTILCCCTTLQSLLTSALLFLLYHVILVDQLFFVQLNNIFTTNTQYTMRDRKDSKNILQLMYFSCH